MMVKIIIPKLARVFSSYLSPSGFETLTGITFEEKYNFECSTMPREG